LKQGDKIYVAGHRGLIGSAVVRQLRAQGFDNITTRDRRELDLLDQSAVRAFFESERPEYVFLTAGKTGGLYANDTYRADFIYQNLQIQNNIIHHAFLHETRKLVFYACSSAYPRHCPQPMREEHLLSGYPEPTNEPLAVAKLAGVKMCESYCRQYGCDFISVIPTNVYGINQNYAPFDCLTMVPALIARFYDAKRDALPTVPVWGSGRPARDFMFADDLADASIFLMQHYSDARPINVGTGHDITVREAAEIIRQAVGYEGEIVYETSRADGALTKLQDISRLRDMGWRHKVDFADGVRRCCDDFARNWLKAER
jgi:GDP-L-fucose synthase